jgi:hypothetical protein
MRAWLMSVCGGLVLCALAGQAAASIAPTNWWKFDDIGSGTASDSAGAAPGTLAGTAVMVPGGASAGALDLRNGGWASMGNILPNTGGDFSMSVWIKTNDGTSASTIVAGRHITGTFNGYMMRTNFDGSYGATGLASFYQANSPGNTALGGPLVVDSAWHHLAATYQAGGTLSLYVDGGLAAAIPSTPIIGNAADFIVGGVFFSHTSSLINTFRGLIDDLQMYDRVLTPGEVGYLKDNPGAAIPAPGGALLVGALALGAARRRR